jgi:hypothetical protein
LLPAVEFSVTIQPAKLAAKPYLYSGYFKLSCTSKDLGIVPVHIAYQGVSRPYHDGNQVPLLLPQSSLPEQLKYLQGSACIVKYTGDTVSGLRGQGLLLVPQALSCRAA